jgi:hypothetical protein
VSIIFKLHYPSLLLLGRIQILYVNFFYMQYLLCLVKAVIVTLFVFRRVRKIAKSDC